MKLHPCEPSLEELISIRSSIYTEASTEENVKQIKALESQIERHKAGRDANNAKSKTSEGE